jgi:hypothetical protein
MTFPCFFNVPLLYKTKGSRRQTIAVPARLAGRELAHMHDRQYLAQQRLHRGHAQHAALRRQVWHGSFDTFATDAQQRLYLYDSPSQG